MSNKSLPVQAKEARNEYLALIDLISTSEKMEVLKGRQLYRLKANNAYKKALGDDVTSWTEFISLPEIGLSTSEANRMMEIYEVFIQRYGLSIDKVAEAKKKSLHYLLPIAKSGAYPKEKVEELMEKAINLSQNDFREEVYDAKVKEESARTYEYLVMQKTKETGTMKKVSGISSEEILEAFSKKINHVR